MKEYITEYSGSDNTIMKIFSNNNFVLSYDSAINFLSNYYNVPCEYGRSINCIKFTVNELDLNQLKSELSDYSFVSNTNDIEGNFTFNLSNKYLSVFYRIGICDYIELEGVKIESPISLITNMYLNYNLNSHESEVAGLPPIRVMYTPYFSTLSKIIKYRDELDDLMIAIRRYNLNSDELSEFRKLIL